MPSYRVYFRAASKAILARKDFDAEHDDAAKVMAQSLLDAASDVATDVDLWIGARHVGTLGKPSARSVKKLRRKTEEAVIRTEERLVASE